MVWLVWIWLAGALTELVVQLPVFWRARLALAPIGMTLNLVAIVGVLVWRLDLFSVILAAGGLYRVFNQLRIMKARMHEMYLRRATQRTSLVLLALQLVLTACWLAWITWHTTGYGIWSALAIVELLAASLLLASTSRNLARTAWPPHDAHLSDGELPTITVAIPARNETEDLQECLETLIASNYPKLEILVLDDCSQNRHTPEIIRGFAHDGVRFLEGEEPKLTWLSKNQAYDRLLREASGEYVLFCGVDARFAPNSLRQLVATMIYKEKAMISLLPWRAAGAERHFAVVQAMRYLWELAPPRRLFNRPPVLSSCWIAKKDVLTRAGGFAAVARAIVPEAHFAKVLSKKGDSYSFMRASKHLGIESTKPAKEQRDTAIRMRYPQLRRRPENVFLFGFTYGFILLPFLLIPAGFFISVGPVAHVMTLIAASLYTIAYLRVAVATRTGSPWLGFVAPPAGLLYDLVLVHSSMWQYEFSEIEWKGRNVCIPAMHVIPHLPKID